MEYSLKEFQSIGRVTRPGLGKSMHNYGIAIDMALFPKDYKGWRIPDYRVISLECDRSVASMMALIAAQRLAMNSTYGIPKERLGKPTNISPIYDMSIIEDMLHFSKFFYRSKYKPMYKFKNSFAATGSIINLLRFEQELYKLGYGTVAGMPDVFNYRGAIGEPAKYITSGVHGFTTKGVFMPAMNAGGSIVVFNLDTQFEKAVEYASQKLPLYITEDGTEIYDTQTKVYGLKKVSFENEGNHYPKDRVYRDHVIVETAFSMQISPTYKWFGSIAAAKKHVDNTVPVFTTEDGVPKFAGDTVWYVRPNFVYHFWRSGIKADSNIENNLKQGYKFFNTEEGCVNYIKRNKPYFHLSQNEMQEFLNDFLKPLGLASTVEVLEFPKDFVKRD